MDSGNEQEYIQYNNLFAALKSIFLVKKVSANLITLLYISENQIKNNEKNVPH